MRIQVFSLTKMILCTKIFAPSFRNDSHISYRNEYRTEPLISKRQSQSISKGLRALSLLSKRQSYIISKRVSFQNYSFQRDNHLSFLKDCPQGIIHPLSKRVDLLSFLADSILTRRIMPCLSRLSDLVSEPFLSDFVLQKRLGSRKESHKSFRSDSHLSSQKDSSGTCYRRLKLVVFGFLQLVIHQGE